MAQAPAASPQLGAFPAGCRALSFLLVASSPSQAAGPSGPTAAPLAATRSGRRPRARSQQPCAGSWGRATPAAPPPQPGRPAAVSPRRWALLWTSLQASEQGQLARKA